MTKIKTWTGPSIDLRMDGGHVQRIDLPGLHVHPAVQEAAEAAQRAIRTVKELTAEVGTARAEAEAARQRHGQAATEALRGGGRPDRAAFSAEVRDRDRDIEAAEIELAAATRLAAELVDAVPGHVAEVADAWRAYLADRGAEVADKLQEAEIALDRLVREAKLINGLNDLAARGADVTRTARMLSWSAEPFDNWNATPWKTTAEQRAEFERQQRVREGSVPDLIERLRHLVPEPPAPEPTEEELAAQHVAGVERYARREVEPFRMP